MEYLLRTANLGSQRGERGRLTAPVPDEARFAFATGPGNGYAETSRAPSERSTERGTMAIPVPAATQATWRGTNRIPSPVRAPPSRCRATWETGDADNAALLIGQDAGLIHDIPPAGEIVERLVAGAEALLKDRLPKLVRAG